MFQFESTVVIDSLILISVSKCPSLSPLGQIVGLNNQKFKSSIKGKLILLKLQLLNGSNRVFQLQAFSRDATYLFSRVRDTASVGLYWRYVTLLIRICSEEEGTVGQMPYTVTLHQSRYGHATSV